MSKISSDMVKEWVHRWAINRESYNEISADYNYSDREIRKKVLEYCEKEYILPDKKGVEDG